MSSLRRWIYCGILSAWVLSPTFAVVHAQGTAVAPSQESENGVDESDSPTLVVSTSRLDQLMPHISYLMRAVNQPEFSGLANMMVTQYTQGMDKTRPIGVAVTLSDVGNPTPVVMLPVNDLDLFFNSIAQFGQPDDLGDGLFSLDLGPTPVFALFANEWLLVSSDEDAVTDFEFDPLALLEKLSNRYDIGVKLDLQSIPDELRESLLAQMRDSFDRAAAMGANQAKQTAEAALKAAKTDEERVSAEAQLAGFEASMEMQSRNLEKIEEMIDDVETVVFGLTADSAAKQLSIEVATEFVEESDLDKQITLSGTAKTAFSGLSSNKQVISINGCNITLPDTIDDAKDSIEMVFSQLDKMLKGAESKMPGITDMANEFKELVLETVSEGIADSSVSVTIDNQVSIAAVSHVADGNKLASFLAANYEKFREFEKNLPMIQFNKSTHAGVTLHTGAVNLPGDAPAEVAQVIGSPIEFAIGTADKAVYLCLGADAESKLKSAIDKVAAKSAPVAGSPFDMKIQLTPILQYIQTIKSDPMVEAMIDGASQSSGKDFVSVSTRIVSHGLLGRLSIDEAVLKAIGSAVKAGQGGKRGRSGQR